MKKKRLRADKLRETLRTTYPHVKTQLHHETPFQLLAATILSAQCTDKQVNRATPGLFARLKTPEDFTEAPLETIETLIRSTGFFHVKAKRLQDCAQTLLDRFDGRVPDAMEDLLTLPGVGRKTANVVLGAVFNTPGLVVDTHVARISRRFGLTENKDPTKIETDLAALIPKEDWSDFSLRLVYFGREICNARKPRCTVCPVLAECPHPAGPVH
ncbi:MAG: endonuclease III [Desulfobacterales bacterium]|nr:endonuclease III [Desulfobacterales bacterium]